MTNKTIICSLIFIAILSFLLGAFVFNPKFKIEYITETETIYDTVYVESEPIVKWKTAVIEKVAVDTVFVTETDTILVQDTIAVAKDEVTFDEGHLRTLYYFPPVNQFQYHWEPFPHEVITQTKTIYISEEIKWYQGKELWGIAGLVLGFSLGK